MEHGKKKRMSDNDDDEYSYDSENSDISYEPPSDTDQDELEPIPLSTSGLGRQVSYVVNDKKQIESSLRALVTEFCELTSLSKEESILLLRFFKWDKDTALESYYGDVTNVSEATALTMNEAMLLLLHSNWERVEDSSTFRCIFQWQTDPEKTRIDANLPFQSQLQSNDTALSPCMLCGAVVRPPVSVAPVAMSAAMLSKETSDSSQSAMCSPSSTLLASTKSASSASVASGLKRITKELRELTKNDVEFSLPNEDSCLTLVVVIKASGWWTGINVRFQFTLATNYPFESPKVICLDKDKCYHPNVDSNDGNICLSLLSSEWSPTCSLYQVCLAIGQLFVAPNWDHAIQQEILAQYRTNLSKLSARIKRDGGIGIDADTLQRMNTSASVAEPLSPAQHAGRKKQLSEKRRQKKALKPSAEAEEILETDQTFSLSCRHTFCRDCWGNHIGHSVSKGRESIFMCCPGAKGRKCSLVVPEAFVSRFASDSYERYQQFQVETFISEAKTIKYCPLPNCNRVVEYRRGNNRRIISCGCGGEWCWGCADKPHLPVACSLIENWNSTRSKVGLSSAEIWEAINIKTCPHCKRRIWKDGGCNHVTCYADKGGCGKEFCWLCLEPYHSSSFSCTKYDERVAKGTLKGEALAALNAEREAKKNQKEKEKYEWHLQRKQAMEASRDFALSTRNVSKLEALGGQLIDKLMEVDSGLQAVELTSKLLKANTLVAKGRDVCQWLYLVAYFNSDKESYTLLSDNHEQLEQYTERLSFILETGAYPDEADQVSSRPVAFESTEDQGKSKDKASASAIGAPTPSASATVKRTWDFILGNKSADDIHSRCIAISQFAAAVERFLGAVVSSDESFDNLFGFD